MKLFYKKRFDLLIPNIHFIKDFLNKRSILVGRKITVVKGKDYLGMTGKIEYCDNCCHSFRIQFDNIGNNELYKNYKDKLIFIE